MRVIKDKDGGIVRRVLLLDDGGEPVVPVVRYLGHLIDAGYSPHTACAYGYDLRYLFEFLGAEGVSWQAFGPSTALISWVICGVVQRGVPRSGWGWRWPLARGGGRAGGRRGHRPGVAGGPVGSPRSAGCARRSTSLPATFSATLWPPPVGGHRVAENVAGSDVDRRAQPADRGDPTGPPASPGRWPRLPPARPPPLRPVRTIGRKSPGADQGPVPLPEWRSAHGAGAVWAGMSASGRARAEEISGRYL